MKIELNLNEVLFLMDKMKIKELVGISSEDNHFDIEEAIKTLAEKEYVYRRDGKISLKKKIQNLFICWNDFGYLIQRPVMNTEERKVFIITDEIYICMFDIDKNDIHVRTEFFKDELMDLLITNMLELKQVSCEKEFIQNLQANEVLDLLDKDVNDISKRTGIEESELIDFEEKITKLTPSTMLAFHNDEKVFIKTVQTENATYLFKDTNYNDEKNTKKFTIAKGSTQYIVDSIYNL